ncbi:MAG: hypothetical protein JO190_01065 [Candidatus Eremiobacteraeota bacterium]|nr:hypothetical protein [Candidatus Eremiobacteraeota bacterium]MBV8498732.1 hypothetical protein [Candidatus Eremiobacteraeota bacterium]
MRNLISARYAFVGCAAFSILAGCGGSSSVGPSVLSGGSGVAPTRSHNYQVLYRFQGGRDGYYPVAGLLAENGQFFGTTDGGGGFGNGTAFKISPSGTKNIIYNFQGYPADGIAPEAGLTAGPNGVLYGATLFGGGTGVCASGPGCGIVYELVPSGSGYAEKVIHAFSGGNDGAFPAGTLLLDQSGALYGTTLDGGGSQGCINPPSYTTGCGTVFKLTPAGSSFTESILYSFQGGNDGGTPRAGLIADGTGALYGTTEFGGANASACTSPSGVAGCGTVFKLTPSGSVYNETILYRFQGGTDGAVPRSRLLAGSNGTLFGVTERGGAVGTSTNHGTVYELTPWGSGYFESIILRFRNKGDAFGFDENGLYADGQHNLYGTTASGGNDRRTSCGVVFELHSANGFQYTSLYKFEGLRAGQRDGCAPIAGLVTDSSGTLYGTTEDGGHRGGRHHGWGTVYKLSP